MKVQNQPNLNPQTVEKTKGSRDKQVTENSQTGARGEVAAKGGAEVQISDTARFMKQAFETAKGSPDIRREKIESLKRQINDGTYKVDAGALADRILDDHILTDFGKNRL